MLEVNEVRINSIDPGFFVSFLIINMLTYIFANISSHKSEEKCSNLGFTNTPCIFII
ncbi:hypothetical protein J2S16_001748 [Cytobacillus kochii]|nr:hypothetical protein [Cytobacillus kochii]